MDVEAVAEHLTNAEWYEIRENLIGLLKRAYDQADEEERQAAALSRAAATDCQPQTLREAWEGRIQRMLPKTPSTKDEGRRRKDEGE